jgi:hypothetical protein
MVQTGSPAVNAPKQHATEAECSAPEWEAEVDDPATAAPEFIAYAKANPGKINYGSAGPGSGSHVNGELFKMMAGVNMVHVPYRGGGPLTIDLIGGQVQVKFNRIAPMIGYIRTDKLRALAVTTATRSPTMPDHSDGGRLRARLRDECLARHRRAKKHARRNHQQAQQ